MSSLIPVFNALLVIAVLVGGPIWLLCRLKQPTWVKFLIGFNYFALLCSFYLLLATSAALGQARAQARDNIGVLAAVLRSRPAEVRPVLEKYLHGDEGSYFLLRNELPGTGK